jgi:hypothetical protein
MRKVIIRPLFLLLMLVIIATCENNAQEESWSLVGSWINQAYETIDGYSAKVVYLSDGSAEVYKLLSDAIPIATGTYVIDDDWTESGIHWFKVTAPMGGTTYYEIDKLSNGGNTYESVASTVAYPAQFDPLNPSYYYTIRYRQ